MHPSKMPLAAQGPPASTLNSRGSEAKKSRKSSPNLDGDTTKASRRRRSSRPPAIEAHPPTEQVPVDAARSRAPSVADEIDSWPTQAMEGAALTDLTNEMARTETIIVARVSTSSPPATKDRGAATQAIRVLVWRAPDGIRVAPLGTTVQAPTVEAMLVALDPSADLAAWLVRRS
jgi:hypothetical protein